MSESKQINQGAVSTLADTDLVMACDSGGTFRPISIGNFIANVKEKDNIFRSTAHSFYKNEWIRIAKCLYNFVGIIMATHVYNTGTPDPIVICVGGYDSSSNFIKHKVLMEGSSFSAVRFVRENDVTYLEIRLNVESTSSVTVSALGYRITLLNATVSNASEANVLKQIALSGG